MRERSHLREPAVVDLGGDYPGIYFYKGSFKIPL